MTKPGTSEPASHNPMCQLSLSFQQSFPCSPLLSVSPSPASLFLLLHLLCSLNPVSRHLCHFRAQLNHRSDDVPTLDRSEALWREAPLTDKDLYVMPRPLASVPSTQTTCHMSSATVIPFTSLASCPPLASPFPTLFPAQCAFGHTGLCHKFPISFRVSSFYVFVNASLSLSFSLSPNNHFPSLSAQQMSHFLSCRKYPFLLPRRSTLSLLHAPFVLRTYCGCKSSRGLRKVRIWIQTQVLTAV